MGFRNASTRTTTRTTPPPARGRRIGDRVRAAISGAWSRWTSPYTISDDLTEHEILHLTDARR